mmetsp:Transcript_649/g.599  ORF Transcript_649/g.599 Transcript_649/m.599 type:complete len:93 (+) Transcript_649:559-837(+)
MFEREIEGDKSSQNYQKLISKKTTEATNIVVDSLFKLLVVDPPFRIGTMKLIAKLIINLSLKKDIMVMMSQENLKIFNDGYQASINKLTKFL